MLISRPSNSGLKRLINIQKCRSSTKLDHCAVFSDLFVVSHNFVFEPRTTLRLGSHINKKLVNVYLGLI